MPRVKLPSGGWRDLDEATTSVVPFQRANGVVMTADEVAAVGKGGSTRPLVVVPRRRWVDPAEVWEAVQRLGTQVAAAVELGITQTSVQNKLDRHMAVEGIEGPRPGLLPKGARVLSRPMADHGEPSPVVVPSTLPLAADPEPLDEPPIQIDIDALATLADLETNIVRIAETAGRLEGITDVLENGWMQELSDVQAALVLSAIVSTIGRTSHDEAKRIMGALDAHGFHLVIRLKS